MSSYEKNKRVLAEVSLLIFILIIGTFVLYTINLISEYFNVNDEKLGDMSYYCKKLNII